MVVIQIENLWKEYRLGVIGHGTLTHDLQSWWARVRGKEDPNAQLVCENSPGKQIVGEQFWALRDIDLEVNQGEVLGIIGRNGAGKSTLLKILSRVTAPTRGVVRIKGRIASLLEVGTGFHPELTGRENVFLNGSILGLSRKEISKRFDDIVAFSELEQFIDSPVKTYSSGMYVRLGFAVATNVDPDVLLIDEILAVGDEAFQRKSLDKLYELKRQKKTIIVVSHALSSISEICDEAIWLEKGEVKAIGPARKVVATYLREVNRKEEERSGNADEESEAVQGSRDRKSTRLNSSHTDISRMPSSA